MGEKRGGNLKLIETCQEIESAKFFSKVQVSCEREVFWKNSSARWGGGYCSMVGFWNVGRRLCLTSPRLEKMAVSR